MQKLVTVFGGSGFLGTQVVRALARKGLRIRVAVRRPELCGHLRPMGRVGQIHAVQANLRYPDSVARAVADARSLTSLATTPNPRPASPARAASIVALSASRVV